MTTTDETVKELFNRVLAAAKKSKSPDWMRDACVDEKGKVVANIASAMVALRNAPEISNCFAFDEMLCAPVIVKALPASQDRNCHYRGSLPRPATDEDVSQLQEWLQEHAALPRLGKDTCHQAADLRARELAFHPVKDYLNVLEWDGLPRLEKWLAYYLGADHSPYAGFVGKAFFIALVARIFQPGCKQDYMMILEGPQGLLKSKACEVIAGKWFSDNLPEITAGKDVSQHLQGKWLVEVGELASMNKSETSALKAFVTRTTERYRPSYGRKEVIQPRQCVFVGSTNDDHYLKDPTGGRRFWPVKVNSIDIGALDSDRDQLFAEAVHLYRDGAKWWPDREFEAGYIKQEQDARFDADAWQEAIENFVEDRTSVGVLEIARECLHLEIARVTRRESDRIGGILKHLKWTPFKSNNKRGYRRPE